MFDFGLGRGSIVNLGLMCRGLPSAAMTELAADPRVIDAEAPVYNARLVRREDETESLAYFWVRFDGEPTPFEPGQYMTIGVMVDGKIVQRPYSVASPPIAAGTDGYEFYVRLVQGGTFTPLLWRMPIGQGMRMIGPKGKFILAARATTGRISSSRRARAMPRSSR